MSIHFSSIGGSLTIHTPVSELSGRDKVSLFQWLMEDLGITRRLQENPDETEAAQVIIAEQWDLAWEGKPQDTKMAVFINGATGSSEGPAREITQEELDRRNASIEAQGLEEFGRWEWEDTL